MAAPVISSPTISDSSITTEDSTRISMDVANTPLISQVEINGESFELENTVGTTFSIDLMGYKIGTGTSLTITLTANNTDGGDMDNSSLTVTVTDPDLPLPVEDKVIKTIIELITSNAEGLEDFNNIKTKTDKLVRHEIDSLEKYPILWIHPLTAVIKGSGVGGKRQWFNPLVVALEFYFDTESEVDPKPFYKYRESLTRLFQRKPHLNFGNNLFRVDSVRMENISYPTNTLTPPTIILNITVDLENVE